MSYNGWSNYETWNVGLWNDWSDEAAEVYAEAEADDTFSKAERATLDLADRIKDQIEEFNPLADEASMYSDLLNAALSEVNWHEIAKHYISDAESEADAD